MSNRGIFIVIEGTDGSGKKVQTDLLVSNLTERGFDVVVFDFPTYGEPSAYFVEKYLRGEYQRRSDALNPKRASLFYALDRFEQAEKIQAALSEGKVVVSNRYVASNMGHQGAKFENTRERFLFFAWLDELEYAILGIPRPDMNFVLHVSADIAFDLIAKKGERRYLEGASRDIHEKDIDHLRRAEMIYLQMVQMFPEEFTLIECVENNKLCSQADIQELLSHKVSQLLREKDLVF